GGDTCVLRSDWPVPGPQGARGLQVRASRWSITAPFLSNDARDSGLIARVSGHLAPRYRLARGLLMPGAAAHAAPIETSHPGDRPWPLSTGWLSPTRTPHSSPTTPTPRAHAKWTAGVRASRS